MAYGVVPIASDVGSIPEYLAHFSSGSAIKSRDPRMFSAEIKSFLHVPARWDEHSRNAVIGAQQFSYDKYLQDVCKLLELPAPVEAVTA
jgi:glycosyltransferase involved in cell wall biosynthesis